MVEALIGDVVAIHVRERRLSRAIQTAATPGVGLEAGDGAVLLAADLDLAVCGRSMAGDGDFAGPLGEDFDGRAAGLLREDGGELAPLLGCELGAESAANVVHLHLDVAGG